MPAPKKVPEKAWLEYAYPGERKIIELFFERSPNNGPVALAKELGIQRRAIYDAYKRAEKRAIAHGWSPEHGMTQNVPNGYHVQGVSALYNKDGERILQWVKSRKDVDDLYKQLFETLEILSEEWEGKSPKVKLKPGKLEDRLTVYPVADPHIGMYAWAMESGDDYDTNIAKDLLLTTMQRLVDSAPKTKTALICNLGDFFHSDNDLKMTMRGGNKLDVDTRWAAVARAGFEIFLSLIIMALKKHEKVDIIIDVGNHDDYTSAMLAIALDAYFRNDKRVNIDLSPAKFHFYKFGKVLIGTTHGDTVKIKELGKIMAVDRAEDWGKTKHRYFYSGHLHKKIVEEQPGCVIEVFNTLAAKDFWTASKGYRSKRNMVYIVHDKEHGEVERFTVDIGQVKQ